MPDPTPAELCERLADDADAERCGHEWCSAAQAALRASASEIARLSAGLYRTADGVPITIGMRVYPELLNDYGDDLDDGGVVVCIREDGEIEIRDSQGEKGPHFLEAHAANVYSTREASQEAAAAARKEQE